MSKTVRKLDGPSTQYNKQECKQEVAGGLVSLANDLMDKSSVLGTGLRDVSARLTELTVKDEEQRCQDDGTLHSKLLVVLDNLNYCLSLYNDISDEVGS